MFGDLIKYREVDFYMDNYESNYEGYEHLRLYPEESIVITALKAVLGAVIGAIPGMALWIIIGKIGYVTSLCGMLIALGIIAGYHFMTKNSDFPIKVGLIICLIVMIIAIYVSQRIIWTWVIADAFQEMIPTMRDSIFEQAKLEGIDITREELNEFVTDEVIDELLVETYGFSEGTFSECSSNFSDLLKILELKGDYISSLLKSYLFAFLGGVGLFANSLAKK